jgi:hypothetical protein
MVSGAEQFPLDVDLGSLRLAQKGLLNLAQHLDTVPTRTGRIVADVHDGWTGTAATAMKEELAGLGTQCARFGPMFLQASLAVKSFANDVEAFQLEILPGLVRGWDKAEADAGDAYRKADLVKAGAVGEAKLLTRPGDATEASAAAGVAHRKARDQAADSQHQTMKILNSQFAAEKAALVIKAKSAGDALADKTVFAVPDSVAKDFTGRGGGGLFGGLGDLYNRFFMPDLGIDELPGMTLVARKHAIEDAGTVAGSVQDWRKNGGPIDPATLAMLQKRKSDRDFASTLLQDLGPEALAALPGELTHARVQPTADNAEEMSGERAWRKSAPEMLQALGVVLATGTSATGDAALPKAWTPKFLEAAKKENYAPIVALEWSAQKAQPNIQFGPDFLIQSTNAITDFVKADIDLPSRVDIQGPERIYNRDLLMGTLNKYASDSNYAPRFIYPTDLKLAAGWLNVDDPMHTMFQALGDNKDASIQWLHQDLPKKETDQGHFMSTQVEFWLGKHPDTPLGRQSSDYKLWGNDKGAGFGKVLQAGMTSGDALAQESAQNTAFFFREMGANKLELPEGAKAGVRDVFTHQVDALNWNTAFSIPQDTMLNVMDNSGTLGRDDTGQPIFYQEDVKWLLTQSFNTDKQVAEYAKLSLGHLRQDFNGLAQTRNPSMVEFANRFGQWKGLLTNQNNKILETDAIADDKMDAHKKAFASFLLAVLTAPIDKLSLGLPSTLAKMADRANYKGQIALTDSMLSKYFQEKSNIDKAQTIEGDTSDASYSDGKAMLVQWAVENGLLDALEKNGTLKKTELDQLRAITTKSPTGYTIESGAPFQQFIRDNGGKVLEGLKLDSYPEAFSFDPAASSKSK